MNASAEDTGDTLRPSSAGRFPKGLAGVGMPEAQDGGEGWLSTYLDMITLVMTFFVVLLAFSDFNSGGPAEAAVVPASEAVRSAPAPEVSGLLALDAEPGVQVSMDGDRVTVDISDRLLFASGEAGITAGGARAIDRIAGALLHNGYPLSVEGHTDSLPIATSAFPSNWELSAARASVVLRRLSSRGVDSDRMRAVGYADTRPVATNADEAGRALNRRVRVVVYLEGLHDGAQSPAEGY